MLNRKIFTKFVPIIFFVSLQIVIMSVRKGREHFVLVIGLVQLYLRKCVMYFMMMMFALHWCLCLYWTMNVALWGLCHTVIIQFCFRITLKMNAEKQLFRACIIVVQLINHAGRYAVAVFLCNRNSVIIFN